jgi:hypothetical protein
LGLSGFVAAISVCLTACAQDNEVQGLDFFEHADVRPYDNWAEQKNGAFFVFDGLYWHIQAPAKTSIGDPTLTPTVYYGPSTAESFTETNSLESNSGESIWKFGDRMEFGYIEDHYGFMFTTLNTNSQTDSFYRQNAFVVFNDPGTGQNGSQHYLDTVLGTDPTTGLAIIGETPVKFTTVYVQNKSRIGGVEALWMYRPNQLATGGTAEFMLGGRYFELKDQFWVDAEGGTLADSYWNTTSHNEIGGPEIAMRLYQPIGRFAISAEGRFTAGVNSQQVKQDGILGSTLEANQAATAPVPYLFSATGFQHSQSWVEFSPMLEFRVEAHVQITNLIAFKAGYTGIWVDNVVRAADMVDYTVPSMGITTANNGNRQSVYMGGVNIGVEVNY